MKQLLIGALALTLTATAAFAQMDKKLPAKSKVADAVMAKEHALIEAVKARNAKTFGAGVMPGAWMIDENGPMNVDDFIKMLGDPKTDISIQMLKASDMNVVDLDATTALVTYKVDQKGTFMGQPLAPVVYVSTIWANHGGTWTAVFHQESPAAPKK